MMKCWTLSLILLYVVATSDSASAFAIGTQYNNIQHVQQYNNRRTVFLRIQRSTLCFINSRYTNQIKGTSTSVYSQNESKVRDGVINYNTNDNNIVKPIEEEKRDYFITDAQFVHLSSAARILTEQFYSHRTNFITFQIEKLKTVLSLESTFPNGPNSLKNNSKYTNKYPIRPLQNMIVACNAKDGQVVGFAEVDARPLGKSGSVVQDAVPTDGAPENMLRSYMYNLAVDKKWKRKGIASALIEACEQYVTKQHDTCIEKRLYLRVRKSNYAAIALYKSLDYVEMDPEEVNLSKEDINSGSLEEGELILFAKDLPLDSECDVDQGI